MKPRFTIISIICCLPLFTSCLGTITVQYDNEPVARAMYSPTGLIVMPEFKMGWQRSILLLMRRMNL